jgi:CRISPR/Cas system-associated endonuclease Cas3-HD
MTSMQIYEANRGSRHKAEVASLVLNHARAHLLEHINSVDINRVEIADVQAGMILRNLSLDVFLEQEPKIKETAL